MKIRHLLYLIAVFLFVWMAGRVLADGFLLNSYRFGTSGGGGGGTVPTVSFTDSDVDATNKTTYTFTSKAIGTADASRYVCVVAVNVASVNQRRLSSMTIGGSAATLITRPSAGEKRATGIACRTVTTGTTATIVVTLTGQAEGCYILVYSLYNLNSTTPLSSGTTGYTTSDAEHSFNYTQDGIIIAGAVARAGTLATTWSPGDTVNQNSYSSTVSGWNITVAADGTAGLLSTTAGSNEKMSSYAHFR